jgi:hypothetical protein
MSEGTANPTLRIRHVQEIEYATALVAALIAAILTIIIAIWLWFFQYSADRVFFVVATTQLPSETFFSQGVDENTLSTSSLSLGVFCTLMSLAMSLAYSILHYRRMIAERADISEVEIVAFSKRDFRNLLAWISMSVVLCLLAGLGTELVFQLMAIIARKSLLVPPIVAVIISAGYVGVLSFFVVRWMLGLMTIDILTMGVVVLVVGVTMAILLTTYANWYENPFSVLGEILPDDAGLPTNTKSVLIFSYSFIAVGFLMLAYFLDMLKFFSIMVEYGHLKRIYSLLVFGVGLLGSLGMMLVGLAPDGPLHDWGAQGAGAAFVGMMLVVPWFVPTRKGRNNRFVAFSAGLGILSILLYGYHLFAPENFSLLGMELVGISFTVIFLYTFTVHSLSYMEALDLPDIANQALEIRVETPKAA